MTYMFAFLEVLSALFILMIGIAVIAIIYMYIADKTQSKQTIRRNYPVIGRFRYLFEKQGEFFRQYFFAMDREELPFNRAERSWVYRAAKNVDRTIAFGSTRSLEPTGTIMFMNCAFPTLDQDAMPPSEITFGEHCRQPYRTNSLFNISAMSYGALSAPAIKALSQGAAKAGCWMNIGEGGVSEHHLSSGADLIFQIGTAKYGVRDEHGNLCNEKLAKIAAYNQVKMFEIKMSQGAKPGKGGILPGRKVTAEIAQIRGIPQGQDSISPNAHAEISNVQDILTMVKKVREVTGKPVGFKVVIGESTWLRDLFSAITQQGNQVAPDFITIDSADGGTGAAPDRKSVV